MMWKRPGLEVGKLAFDVARQEVIREYQEIADSVEEVTSGELSFFSLRQRLAMCYILLTQIPE